MDYRTGDLVFAKAGTRPAWPAKVIAVNTLTGKCRVCLFNLHTTIDIKIDKLTPVTEESKATLGRPRRADSNWKEPFAAAMEEMALSLNYLTTVSPTGTSQCTVRIQWDHHNLEAHSLKHRV